MPEKHQIIFYPVGNGDTSQIILSQGRRILFDFCYRKKAENEEAPEIDLKKRLKEELDGARHDYFDVVAFTHADVDHIQGSSEFFELQHAAKYQGHGRIKIKQLWVPAAMVMESASNDQQSNEFVILRQEARHRLLEGKDILVFSKPQELLDWLVPKLEERGEAATARDHLFIDAGRIVPGFSKAALCSQSKLSLRAGTINLSVTTFQSVTPWAAQIAFSSSSFSITRGPLAGFASSLSYLQVRTANRFFPFGSRIVKTKSEVMTKGTLVPTYIG
jgi:hypothetical protein